MRQKGNVTSGHSLFSLWSSDSKMNGKRLATKKSTKDIKKLIPATVKASDFPCHNPTNQRLKSSAKSAAFPPYSSKSRLYVRESSGLSG